MELKFRAWDGSRARYDVTGFEHGKRNEMGGIFLDGEYYAFDKNSVAAMLKKRWAVAMQFTGLKDKNGKDIYDGDILRSTHFADNENTYYLHHIIRWSDRYHGWQALNAVSMSEIGGSPQLFVYTRSAIDNFYEVVGNIYETPELLGKAVVA